MVRRNGAAIRKDRLTEMSKEVMRLLNKHSELVLSKTVGVFQYDIGLKEERVIEYLKILENMGRFEIDFENDKIRKIQDLIYCPTRAAQEF